MLKTYFDFRHAVSRYSHRYHKDSLKIICAILVPYWSFVVLFIYLLFFSHIQELTVVLLVSIEIICFVSYIYYLFYLSRTKWMDVLSNNNMYGCNISDLMKKQGFFHDDKETLAMLNDIRANDKKISVLLDENARLFEMHQKKNSEFCHIGVFSATVLVGALVYPLSSRYVAVGDLKMPIFTIILFTAITFIMAIGLYPTIIKLCYGNELNVGYVLRNQQIANAKL